MNEGKSKSLKVTDGESFLLTSQQAFVFRNAAKHTCIGWLSPSTMADCNKVCICVRKCGSAIHYFLMRMDDLQYTFWQKKRLF